jgi:hypothetical protein
MNARTMLSLALALLIATPLLAGDKEKKEANPKKGEKRSAKEFSLADMTLKRLAKAELTEEQVSKIEALSEQHTPKVLEARKKLASVLTDEQKKQRREAFATAKKAGKKPSEVITSFKLTTEQQEVQKAAQKQMRECQGAYNKAVFALLSPEQRKKAGGARKEGADKKPALKKAGEKKATEKKAEKKPAE